MTKEKERIPRSEVFFCLNSWPSLVRAFAGASFSPLICFQNNEYALLPQLIGISCKKIENRCEPVRLDEFEAVDLEKAKGRQFPLGDFVLKVALDGLNGGGLSRSWGSRNIFENNKKERNYGKEGVEGRRTKSKAELVLYAAREGVVDLPLLSIATGHLQEVLETYKMRPFMEMSERDRK